MKTVQLQRESEWKWTLPGSGSMRVPGIIYASQELADNLEKKVLEQIAGVASLPGIISAAYAMPDAHCGYGFPIGGVAAFDPEGGVVSAGGVGFDISCGVRTLLSGIHTEELEPVAEKLADSLFNTVPAGIGSTGRIRLDRREMDAMLIGGARWAAVMGYGTPADLARIEHHGEIEGANPDEISARARERQQDQMGTLGSGNHYLEVQQIVQIFDINAAAALNLRAGEIVISIHCGSRGLGHQVATEFSRSMASSAAAHGIRLPDRELACAPFGSREGKAYLGAMRSAMNCALANRQIITHLVRDTFSQFFSRAGCPLLYDVSHNTCSMERHNVNGAMRDIYVHRKGATRALPPGHPELPPDLGPIGQPVLIGGSMGTASYILVGCEGNDALSFSSACHGAGRRLSRAQASKQWRGDKIVRELAHRRILIRSRSTRGIAEEAPGAYKDVTEVVDSSANAGLARKVAKLLPMICIKG